MSTSLTALALQFASPRESLWDAPPRSAVHILRLSQGPGQQAWVADEHEAFDPAAHLPSGSVFLDAPISSLPAISETPGLTSGEAKISGGTYKILDDKGELGVWLQGKAANGLQMFGATIEHYVIDAGEFLENEEDLNRALLHTWQVKGTIGLDDKEYSFRCDDINRNAERDIFEKRAHPLMRTLAAEDRDVYVHIPTGAAVDLVTATWAWEHGSDYHIHPGEIRAIGVLQNGDSYEYISWTAVEDAAQSQALPDSAAVKLYRLVDVERGLFGSKSLEWTVDSAASLSSRPDITAVPYAEEHFLSLARAAYTGYTLDGRWWPWGLNIPEAYINGAVLAAASMETPSQRLTIRSPEKTTAKKFVEEHCLARRGIFTVNPRGELSYLPTPIGSAAEAFVLDEDLVDLGALNLVNDDSDTATATTIEWDKDPISEKFRKTTTFTDPAALGETSATEPVVVEAPYVTTNRSTEADVLAQGRVLHARHARPVKRLEVKPVWGLASYSPGTVVRARLPVKDYAVRGSGISTLNVPMMIASTRKDYHNESLAWSLIGFRSMPGAMEPSRIQQLPESEYRANGTLLEVNEGVASMTQVIDLTKKYFHIGPLTLPDGWPVAFVNRGGLNLWVRGVLLWGADVDLGGRGGAGGAGGTDSSGSPGERGLISAPRPSGSIKMTVRRFENSQGEPQAIDNIKVYSRPPSSVGSGTGLNLPSDISVQQGRIVGRPSNPMGSGGQGGDASVFRGPLASDDYYLPGSKGGDGGAYVDLVCSAGSGFVGNGAIKVSGRTAEQAGISRRVYGAAGAGGAHGRVRVFHDTEGTPWQFDSNRLEAYHGYSLLNGTRLPETTFEERNRSSLREDYRSFYDPAFTLENRENNWLNAYSVEFLPATEQAQDSVYSYSLLRDFFDLVLDGNVKIVIADEDPSDGNVWDMLISQSALDSNEPQPPIKVLRQATGWTEFDWENDQFAYVYAGLIANNRTYGSLEIVASATRPETGPGNYADGTIWFNTDTGAEWVLFHESDDILLRINDVPVGENLILPDGQFIFTRNESLQPISIVAQPGSVAPPDSESGGDGATPGNDAVFNVRYEAPFLRWDGVSGATSFDVKKGSVVAQQYVGTVNSAPFQLDLSSAGANSGNGSYFITAIPSGINSESVSVNVEESTLPAVGFTLYDTGRTVDGVARPNNGNGPYIEQGKEVRLTLGIDTASPTVLTETVGVDGAFTFTVSSAFDRHLGERAQLYAINGGDDFAVGRFTYENV